jgi:UMF1 family MFS transporter
MTTKARWPTIHAWALYDFASTAFYMNFISTYFALWVVKDQGADDLTYGLAKSLSMLAVAIVSPKIGAMSDRAGARKPFIVASTLVYVVGGAAIAFTGNLWVGLVLIGLANIGLQLSGVFYNALLPSVAPPSLMGRISGYGRAVGYVGSLVAVLLGMAYATGKVLGHPVPWIVAGGSQAVFLPTALLALVAAFPLFMSRETRPEGAATTTSHDVSWKKLVGELRTDPALQGAGLFLLGSFFFFDTINTIRDFMSVYLVKVVGLSETDGSLQGFLLVVVLCSLLGALLWGFVADRLTPKKALVGVLVTMFVGFGGLVVLHDPKLVKGLLGPLLGLAFGGVLVTTRPLLAQLVPEDRRGEFFGVFILCNDFAAILGPVTWGVVVKALQAHGTLAYQAALATQLVFLVLGLVLVLRVRDPGARTTS